MDDRVLPIGSVVTLKGNPTRLMIVGYLVKNKETDTMYDYCACIFPNGLDVNNNILFNREDIDVIFFIGYQNKKSILSTKLIKDCIDKIDKGENVEEILTDLVKDNIKDNTIKGGND